VAVAVTRRLIGTVLFGRKVKYADGRAEVRLREVVQVDLPDVEELALKLDA
jgi:hypothetical protein